MTAHRPGLAEGAGKVVGRTAYERSDLVRVERVQRDDTHGRLETGLASGRHCDRQPERDRSLIHHSDRGSQYVSIRYSERLAQAGIESSVGSKGDSYDNALAETINGLYKAELIHRRTPWKTLEAVELATLEW